MKACTNAYFSLAHLEVNNQKLEPFVMASEVLEAPRSRKEKMTTTLTFWGQEIKGGVNVI